MINRIYFLGERISGVGIMRGKQVSIKLNSLGYDAVYQTYDNISHIRNSIVFILKFPHSMEDFIRLKNANNKIVWDIQDYECYPSINRDFYPDRTPFEVSDCCIFLNSITPKELSKFVKMNWVVIPHHWDERLRETISQKNEFQFGYYGSPDSCEYLNLIESKTCITSQQFYQENNMISIMQKINCHCDIKHANSLNFFGKSALKLATAAAVESNIILNRGFSSIEVLNESYPFYIDNTEKSFVETVEFARESFGTHAWNTGLDMLRVVREKTDLNNVIKEYIKLIKSL